MQSGHYQVMVTFIEELQAHLDTLERGLLQLPAIVNDPEAVHQLMRAAHSIKGGAAMLQLTGIQQIARQLEEVLKELKHHPVKIDSTLAGLLLNAFQGLSTLADELQGTFGLSPETTQATLQMVEPTFIEIKRYLSSLSATPINLAAQQSGLRSASGQGRPRRWSRLTAVINHLWRLWCRGVRWLSQRLRSP